MTPVPQRLLAGPHGIKLLLCRLDDDADIAIDTAWQCLDAAESIRASRFHFERDRVRYVRGRGFLRRELGSVLGLPPAAVVLREGAHGKPEVVVGRPQFNLSNSDGFAVLAIRDDGPVGVDLEFYSHDIDALSLARACMQPHEIAVLARVNGVTLRERFFSFWTAKEALMKLCGEGAFLDPRNISLDLDAGLPVGFRAPAAYTNVRLAYPKIGLPAAVCSLAWTTLDA